MRVISRRTLLEAAARHRDLQGPLDAWYRIAKTSSWMSLEDVRKTYPSADYVDPYTVFNIKGNSYRLVVKIEYRWRLIFVKRVLTHAEYDRGDWKR
ncbi:MAG TPA: type II toxin-antitoxin system HigB family toxin [Terriglobales bacterium]|nr:type II toxin-antitoxin system HigB family toxin [Terriglobales bacterium]